MKKLIALAMATIICLSFTGCTPKSQDVKQTEIMINAIGEVTDQSGEDILLAESMYRHLTDEEKGQVKNYSSLTQAREKYNQLIHYGQWVQFFDKEAVTFTLKDDGSFTMSDGRSGKYEISDSFVVLLTDDGETITLEKETNKNLLHLKTEDADYIRPELLTVKKEKIIALVILILRSLREDTMIPHLCQYGVDVCQVFGKGEMQFQMNMGIDHGNIGKKNN